MPSSTTSNKAVSLTMLLCQLAQLVLQIYGSLNRSLPVIRPPKPIEAIMCLGEDVIQSTRDVMLLPFLLTLICIRNTH